ncbi:glycosyl transferase family 2 [Aequorivita soesokkakensis]|uniref:Glycosyl transferase family 2 n=1 Tax=Aequorivita soesokkakensis TaxID=1385699 RepID=A0A1A9LJY4_9FLAO|nr:glycosyltransferase [Aequorivita soesokkakensis]OAD92825.1 glycosyl transferase family 2 [Aequorivita soesokkakensis]
MKRNYSFIIPVFNRPQEVKELLDSFVGLDFHEDFEIVLVEDGSTETSENIVGAFSEKLSISYYFKQNSGPGDSRNFGMKKAKGDYFIILDSDCLLPSHYLTTVDSFLNHHFYHCFGGADAAHSSFTSLQKAINYVMTSFYTTGGIRGSEVSVNRFEPRSFNMGISKEAFEMTGGFAKIHPGEDPDLSQRILKAGYKTTFLPKAFVYHKRRISWKKFAVQVKKFGLVRPILNQWHPESAKITFWFPTVFVFFVVFSVVFSIFISPFIITPLLLYLMLIFVDSTVKNKNITIGFLSIAAVFVQFFGYGIAFLKSSFLINLLKKDPKKQFPSLFFE